MAWRQDNPFLNLSLDMMENINWLSGTLKLWYVASELRDNLPDQTPLQHDFLMVALSTDQHVLEDPSSFKSYFQTKAARDYPNIIDSPEDRKRLQEELLNSPNIQVGDVQGALSDIMKSWWITTFPNVPEFPLQKSIRRRLLGAKSLMQVWHDEIWNTNTSGETFVVEMLPPASLRLEKWPPGIVPTKDESDDRPDQQLIKLAEIKTFPVKYLLVPNDREKVGEKIAYIQFLQHCADPKAPIMDVSTLRPTDLNAALERAVKDKIQRLVWTLLQLRLQFFGTNYSFNESDLRLLGIAAESNSWTIFNDIVRCTNDGPSSKIVMVAKDPMQAVRDFLLERNVRRQEPGHVSSESEDEHIN